MALHVAPLSLYPVAVVACDPFLFIELPYEPGELQTDTNDRTSPVAIQHWLSEFRERRRHFRKQDLSTYHPIANHARFDLI